MACSFSTSCPECGDRLIHQGNRGWRESSSAYGQHMHDDRSHNHYFMDLDGVIYKRETRILRIIECKKPGQSLKKSEETVFNFLCHIMKYAMSGNKSWLHPESGVYVVHASEPFDVANVTNYMTGESLELRGDLLRRFEEGLPINDLATP